MRSTWFAIILLLLSAFPAFSQVGGQTQLEGQIVGTVLDEHNQPVSGAHVSGFMLAEHNDPTQDPACNNAYFYNTGKTGNCLAITDETGQYHMDHLPMGTFFLIASKEEDGYPPYMAGRERQTVTLTPGYPVGTVIAKLGQQEGILAPSVRDKVTGRPVKIFRLRFEMERTDPSQQQGGAARSFGRAVTRTAIPVDRGLSIEVSARGYKKWVYVDPSNPSAKFPVRVQRGEIKSLDIELQPEEENTQTAR
ncbi:MAG TPA: carboxypeptidase-like regulatory domain-containing protein [Terriglobales bacterium]